MNKAPLVPSFEKDPVLESSAPSWAPAWLLPTLKWVQELQNEYLSDLSSRHGQLALATFIGVGAVVFGLIVLAGSALLAYFFVYIAPSWAPILWRWGLISLALIVLSELRKYRRLQLK